MTKHPISILIASRRLNRSYSAPKCNFNLAKSLLKLGYEVHVLTSYIEPLILETLRSYGGIVHVVNSRYASRLVTPVSYSFYAKILKKKYNIDIVIGNGYTIGDDITWVHFPRYGWLETLKKLGESISIKLKLEAFTEKLLFSTSRYFLAVSNMVKNILLKDYHVKREQVIVVHNGVDVKYYHPIPESERSQLRERFDVGDKLLIIYTGGGLKRKGFDVLIREISKMQHKNDVKLLVTGLSSKDIYSSAHVIERNSLKETVILKEWLSPDLLKLYYQISDLYVLPSLFDPFSLATLEAMACGSVPIVSIYAGVAEIINHGVNGYIVDPLHDGDIASTLDDLVTNSSKLSFIRQETIKTANNLSWDNVTRLLMEKIHSVKGIVT